MLLCLQTKGVRIFAARSHEFEKGTISSDFADALSSDENYKHDLTASSVSQVLVGLFDAIRAATRCKRTATGSEWEMTCGSQSTVTRASSDGKANPCYRQSTQDTQDVCVQQAGAALRSLWNLFRCRERRYPDVEQSRLIFAD